jgi:hypothetical protein
LLGTAHVTYMVFVDVPMYWARWRADTEAGRVYLTPLQGLADTAGRWVVSLRWQDWRSEVVRMSLYFSVGVWISLSLIRVPARLLRWPTTVTGAGRRPQPGSVSGARLQACRRGA